MLQLGLRSFAGGNIDAALHRLSTCEQQLRAMLPDAGASRDTANGAEAGAALGEQLSIQLGAVCGSLGDCHRRLGNADEAASSYRESVVQLQRCAVPSNEVRPCPPTACLICSPCSHPWSTRGWHLQPSASVLVNTYAYCTVRVSALLWSTANHKCVS